jgi:hypothetical protein
LCLGAGFELEPVRERPHRSHRDHCAYSGVSILEACTYTCSSRSFGHQNLRLYHVALEVRCHSSDGLVPVLIGRKWSPDRQLVLAKLIDRDVSVGWRASNILRRQDPGFAVELWLCLIRHSLPPSSLGVPTRLSNFHAQINHNLDPNSTRGLTITSPGYYE